MSLSGKRKRDRDHPARDGSLTESSSSPSLLSLTHDMATRQNHKDLRPTLTQDG